MARKAYIGIGKTPIYGDIRDDVKFEYVNFDKIFEITECHSSIYFNGVDLIGLHFPLPGHETRYLAILKLKEDLKNLEIFSTNLPGLHIEVIVKFNDYTFQTSAGGEVGGFFLGSGKKGDVISIEIIRDPVVELTSLKENQGTRAPEPEVNPGYYIDFTADPVTVTTNGIVGYKDGVARQVKDAFIGINTQIPITNRVEQSVPFNTANINKYFDISNGSGKNGWSYSDAQKGDGVVFRPKNFGVNNSTATLTLTLKKNLTNFKIVRYKTATESSYDKFTITSNGTNVINAISGNKTGTDITLTGSSAGHKLIFKYEKDSSNHASETSSYFVIAANPITEVVETVVGHEMKEVARKIKKAYIGENGVAKLCYDILPPPSPLSECSWQQIDEISRFGKAADYWKIGDTKDVVINGETLTFEIIGFNHDDLVSGGKAGITFGMKNLMKNTRTMNSSATNNGGAVGSELHKYINSDIYNNLPADLKTVIKKVNKKTTAGNATTTLKTYQTNLFLFSASEVFPQSEISSGASINDGHLYSRFTNSANRVKKLSNGTDSAAHWWLSSPSVANSYSFCYVYFNGNFNYYSANNSFGVCFGFCI